MRAAFKRRTGTAFVVGPLEGLWSSADPGDFASRAKGNWDWTVLIPLPDAVGGEDAQGGLASARRRKPDLPVDLVAPGTLAEGRCLQTLHVGPYDDEGPLLRTLHEQVMPELGVTWNGRHHEIYLGDPRRAAPEKLRTILRQPVVASGVTA